MACAQDLCYVTGGYDSAGNVQDNAWTFNVTSNVWTEIEQLQVGRGSHAAAIVWTSPTTYVVYVVGGQQSIESGPSQPANSDPNPNPPGCDNCPAFLPLSYTEFYDPTVGFWQQGPDYACSPVPPLANCDLQEGFSNGITKLTCAAYLTTLYCFGGMGVRYPDTGGGEFVPSHHTAWLDVSNASAQWVTSAGSGGMGPIPPIMPVSVLQHSIAVQGSLVYLNGGGCNAVQGNCGGLNPPPMSAASAVTPRAQQTLPQPYTCDNDTPGEGAWASNNTWVFDMSMPQNGYTQVPANMRFWRCAHGSFVDPNGMLYVVGGCPTEGETAPEVEVLNLNNVTLGWSEGPMLPSPAQSFAMTVPTFFNNSRPAGALGGLVVVGPITGVTDWRQNLIPMVLAGYELSVGHSLLLQQRMQP